MPASFLNFGCARKSRSGENASSKPQLIGCAYVVEVGIQPGFVADEPGMPLTQLLIPTARSWVSPFVQRHPMRWCLPVALVTTLWSFDYKSGESR
ncbi:hypothetical protein OK016_01715 [Vibrio chagasii]|nr:hypothetical protein [Vibrio chagasii]